MAPGPAGTRGAFELILGRLLGVVLRATLRRAWVLRSGRWLAVAVGVLVLRLLERSRSTKKPSGPVGA
ncbi:MAG TPA: hypothetical protein VND83_00585 [Acidimicrobiales bacterium]|nr:hypothetical protein [Acidimicrobiales bacterium]